MLRSRPCKRSRALLTIALCSLLSARGAVGAGEPPALNPFAPPKTEREDAAAGYVELSDGAVHAGSVYLTLGARLKISDGQMKRQREIPLRAVRQIDCQVLKEWMEKEWRFKESALDEKYLTGREYPAREYTHTITLQDGRTITGPLEAIVYVRPLAASTGAPAAYRPDVRPEKFVLHKRHKGELGADLKSLVFVKTIRLGEEALKEGGKKARASRPDSAK